MVGRSICTDSIDTLLLCYVGHLPMTQKGRSSGSRKRREEEKRKKTRTMVLAAQGQRGPVDVAGPKPNIKYFFIFDLFFIRGTNQPKTGMVCIPIHA